MRGTFGQEQSLDVELRALSESERVLNARAQLRAVCAKGAEGAVSIT